MMVREDGEEIGRLAILYNQEPADIVYEWSKTYDLDKGYMLDVIDTVCEEEELECNRNIPVIKSVPINSPEGDFVRVFQVRL